MLNTNLKQKILTIHSWTSVITGLILFIIVFSGSIAVFARHELAAWAEPDLRAPLSTADIDYDTIIRTRTAQYGETYGEMGELLVFAARPTNPAIHFSISKPHEHGEDDHADHHEEGAAETDHHADEAPKSIVYDINPVTLEDRSVRLGDLAHIYAKEWTSAMSTFLVHFHTDLWAPKPYGHYFTGLFGVTLMISVITGVITHRRLFAELFTLRLNMTMKIRWLDVHKALGAWTFLFGFVIAFTGTLLSFGVTLLLPLAALVSFRGDIDAAEQVFVGVPEPAGIYQTTANVNDMLADTVIQEPGFVLDRIRIHNLDDKNAVIDFMGAVPQAAHSTALRYNARGEFEEKISGIASAGALNKPLAIALALHYGNFGGPLLQYIWTALGIALSFIIATGLMMWIERRAHGSRGQLSAKAYDRFSRATIGVCAGLPIAVVSTFYSQMLVSAANIDDHIFRMGVIFTLAWAAAIGWTVIRPNLYQLMKELLSVAGILCLGVPVLNALATGDTFIAAIAQSRLTSAGVDLTMAFVGAMLIFAAYKLPGVRPESSIDAHAAPTPAE